MARLIAIVDDDQSVRDALTSLMGSLGHAAVAYASAEEFVHSNKVLPDCLITDLNMPGMTGLQLYDKLIELGRKIPTIFITAYANDAARKRAKQIGECYLTKPFSEEDLLDCVRSAFERSENWSSPR